MSHPSDPHPPRLLGRTQDLEAVEAVVSSAARGAGGFAVIEGEAGIGKTRLLDEIAARASARDLEVWRAGGHQLERDRPYGLLVDALRIDTRSSDPERARLANLLYAEGTDTTTGREGANRYRIIEGIVDLVERVSLVQPALIILDDVHWADSGTALALHRIARSLRQLPMAIVMAARPTPRSAEFAALIEELISDGAPWIKPAPLADDDIAALATETLGASPGPVLARALASTGGNPLFALELARAFDEEHLVDFSGQLAELREVSVPRSLQVTVLGRLAFLGRDVLESLRLASVLGTSFSPNDLVALSEIDELVLMRRLDEARAAGFVIVSDDRFAFRHEVVRDAIYYEIPEPTRRTLHARAAEVLQRAGVAALDMAAHVALGARQGDDAAIEWLWSAGREAMSREPSVAVNLLTRALELCPGTDSRAAKLRADLVLPLTWAGRLAEAEQIALEALEGADDPGVRVKVREHLAQCLEYQGRAADAIGHLKAAVSEVGEGVEQARLFASIAYIVRVDQREEGLAFAKRALEIAERYHDNVSLTLALMGQAWLWLSSGTFESAILAGRRAVDTATSTKDGEALRWLPHRTLAIALLEAGRLDDARPLIDEAQSIVEQEGIAVHAPHIRFLSGWLRYLTGEWDDAFADFETFVAMIADEPGYYDAGFVGARLIEMHLARGDLDAAERALVHTRDQVRAYEAWGEAMVHQAKGARDKATAAARRFVEVTVEEHSSYLINWIPELVHIALAGDDNALAEEIVRRTIKTASNSGMPKPRALAMLTEGVAHRDTSAMVEATEIFRGTPCTLEFAMASLLTGESLIESGDTTSAVAHLENAVEVFLAAAADGLVGRAEHALRTAGMRRGARGKRGRPKTGWKSLTVTERKVLDLIGTGLANPVIAERLYISKRTVETHIAHLLRKLEVTTRAELIAKAHREGASG